MKKIFTCSFMFAVCLGFFASCTKDVKAPAKVAGSTTSRTTSTTTQTTDQNHNDQNHNDHGGCGSGYGNYNSSGY